MISVYGQAGISPDCFQCMSISDTEHVWSGLVIELCVLLSLCGLQAATIVSILHIVYIK